MTAADSAQFKRFISGLDTFSMTANEFQRTDVAPEATFGDGRLTAADQQQIDNYIAVLDPVRPGGGPTGPVPAAVFETTARDSLAEGRGRNYRIASISGSRGSDIIITVELDAKGNETGMSFTLRFDPSRLSFMSLSGIDENPDVMDAADSPPGMFKTVNATLARKGTLGLMLNAPSPFEAGTRQIVALRFRVRGDAPLGPTTISFVDDTIARSTTDADARNLTATYEDGGITIIRPRNDAKMAWLSLARHDWPMF